LFIFGSFGVAAAHQGIAGQTSSIAGSSPMTHVRSSDEEVRQALAYGARHSSTFAELVAKLDDSDVVAYITTDIRSRANAEAYLVHTVVATARARYLTIVVRRPFGRDRIVSVIAHELQHALEVSAAPNVRTGTDILNLYQRIGIGDCVGRFETQAARFVQQRVEQEMAAGRRQARGTETQPRRRNENSP
jgi:hypothetical protein